jgi:four helix bundle protein
MANGGTPMAGDDLRERTKKFALRVLVLVAALPNTIEGRVVGHQLADSGTSVGANYRAACRARSRAEFISKLGIVIEEADESGFWLELVIERGMLPKRRVEALPQEVNELVAVMTASRKTAQRSAIRHSAFGIRH